MKKYDVVIAGYTCVDLIPEFKKNDSVISLSNIFVPGKLIEIDGISFVIGGVVANTGLALKKFNKKVFLNGLVGDDAMGKIAIEWLSKYNISEGILTTKMADTATSIVLAPPGVDRIFLESPGCNQIFDTSFINYEVISQSKIFHFGYPPLLRQFFLNDGSQLSEMFTRVKKMGVLTSLDFSMPDPEGESGRINWPHIMKRILPLTDIFVPSLEEVLQIMMPLKYAQMVRKSKNGELLNEIPVSLIREVGKLIIDSGVKIVMIKAGHRGAYLLTGDVSSINEQTKINFRAENWNYREFWCNAYHADEAKTFNATGAGDTAVAAFLCAILEGHCAETSLKYAAMAGRNNLYCQNIYTDLSNWDEMTNEIELSTVEVVSLEGYNVGKIPGK